MSALPPQPSDEHLAQLAQAGDDGAFETLIRRFEGRVYRLALHWCGRDADAREITQDTFVSAYRHLNRFQPTRSFTTWLFTIARRKWIDHNRRTPRDGEAQIPELADPDDPCVLMTRQEAGHDLWCLARQVLSAAQFQALWLHYVENLSVREIARVMHKTQPHIKVLLFRARAVLGRALQNRSRPGTASEGRAVPSEVPMPRLIHPAS